MSTPTHEMRQVELIDSCHTQGWNPIGTTHHLTAHCHTIGYALQEDDQAITLAQSIDTDNNNADNVITIPLTSLTTITTQRKPRR